MKTVVLIIALTLGMFPVFGQGTNTSDEFIISNAITIGTNESFTISAKDVTVAGFFDPVISVEGGNLVISSSVLDFEGQIGTVISFSAGSILIENSSITNVPTFIDASGSGNITIDHSNVTNSIDDMMKFEKNIAINITDSVFENSGKDTLEFSSMTQSPVLKDITIINSGKDGINSEDSGFFMDGVTIETTQDEGMQLDGLLNPLRFEMENIKVTKTQGNGIRFRDIIGEAVLKNINVEDTEGDGMEFTDMEMNVTATGIAFNRLKDDGLQFKQGEINFFGENITASLGSENGIEIEKTSGTFVFSDVSSNRNQLAGVEVLGVHEGEVLISQSSFTGNIEEGFHIVNSTNVQILSSKFNENGKGLGTEILSIFEISDSSFSSNQFDGIVIAGEGSGSIMGSNMSNNGLNGLTIVGNHQISVTGNRIEKNGWYGVEIKDRTSDKKVDLNNNYWGNEIGPFLGSYNITSNGLSGYEFANITMILGNDGTNNVYEPQFASVIDYRTILAFIVIAFILLALLAFVYWRWSLQKWKSTALPQMTFLATAGGIPIADFSFGSNFKDGRQTILISGFMAAIESFGHDIGDGDKIKKNNVKTVNFQEIVHKNYTFLQQTIGGVFLILIVRSVNYLVRKRFVEFAKMVEVRLGTVDSTFEVDEEFRSHFIEIAKKGFEDFRFD